MTSDSEYRSHDMSLRPHEHVGRPLLKTNGEEEDPKDLAMQKKKRTATSPLRRKQSSTCVTPPDESTSNRRRGDDQPCRTADAASSLLLLAQPRETTLCDAECGIVDIRYKQIHDMSTCYLH